MSTPARLSAAISVALCALWMIPGCDALNPAFVDFVSSTFDEVNISPQGPDSAGHVIIALRNDTVFDEALLDYLVASGLDEALVTGDNVRPLIRMLVTITFLNDEQIQIEFNDGSPTILDPGVAPMSIPDLNREQKNNIVFQCNVARVELASLPSVLVPVSFETTRINPGTDTTPSFRERVMVAPPQFDLLTIDQTDQFGNTVLLQNIDVRDQPAPAISPLCGAVVTIRLSGVLSVPFEVNEFGLLLPGTLDTDGLAQAASPGRFEINVGIR